MRSVRMFLATFALALAGDLHKAARLCDADRMRELLARDASLSAPDEKGMTPLHVAIDGRRMQCVSLLLKAGADGKVRDQRGRTASDAARQIADPRDRALVLDMLWKSGQSTSAEPVAAVPWSLQHSVRRRQTNVTKMLLDLGADPNAVGAEGTTPLADAALKGNLEAVRLLLSRGARLNVTSEAGTQPIHDAALGDSKEVIRELVKHGADVNARTRDEKQTPLHVAAAIGKMTAVKTLVTLGADLTLKDSGGRTPLDAAERAGLEDVAALLKGVGIPSAPR